MKDLDAAPVSELTYTADEMMTVAAARALRDGMTCFVGIGLPSAAANLARATHAPGLVLIYESGTIGAKPAELPLSIGDGILAETADAVVSVPEIFNYWIQPGRIDIGFLGAAQIDKFGNINTTVIGDYAQPKVRLPGAGGAPEIAASCREVTVVLRQETEPPPPREDWFQFLQNARKEMEEAGCHFMDEKEMRAHVERLREGDRIYDLLREVDEQRQKPEPP